MKKLILNKQSENSNLKEKVAYEDFIVIDNYLIIRESIHNLLIFKFSQTSNETLDFFKEIKLKKIEEIKSMDSINPKNVFIVYHTNEIYAIDLETSAQEEVKITMKDKKPFTAANEISMHDQCELKDTNNSIYIGFVSVNNKDLYLAYKDWNSKAYILNCLFIKNFKDEIIHIEYKFLNGNGGKNYCFICVLCKMEGHALIIEVKEEYDLNNLINLLKSNSNWNMIFSESNILTYNYSFYYSNFSYEQNSIVIFTDENKCMVWNFNKNLDEPNKFLTKTENMYKYEKAHNNPIIGINHYDKRLFITTKEDLIEFKLLSALTTASNTIKHCNGILKTKIYDIPNLVYILFLTSKEMWSYQIDLNEGHHKRISSNVSLNALDNKSSKVKHGDKESKASKKSKNSKDSDSSKKHSKKDKEEKKSKKEKMSDKKSNKRSSFLNEKDKAAKKDKTITIRESLNRVQISEKKEKPKEVKLEVKPPESKEKNDQPIQEINIPKCDACSNNAKYRCSLCHKFFICEQGEHTNQWDRHKKNCPMLPKTKKIEHYTNLSKYQPLWNEQRRIIIEHLRKKEFSEAIEKNYILIQDNYNLLNQYEKELKILPFHDMQAIENNKKELLDSFLYYEDYFCNFLLLIHSFSLFKSKDEVWRLLNRLIKEMEANNFTNVTNFLVDEKVLKNNNKNDDQGDNYSNIKIDPTFEKIYLRILKILVTIAKYGNTLGEFSFYEKYLLDYVQKILEVYSKDEYINYNTYLLLGNLYVEYGFLQKGHFLYDNIIDNNNNLGNKERLNDVVLCANYNSGLVNFVIDKYEMAKQRFETALKIKKEFLKEKNDLQISQIYETISEIDIEYKNYSSALINLQKAIESRELSNTCDVEFKLRSEELRNYIIQNSTDNKGDLNSNVQFRRGENTEESEHEKLVLDLIQDTPINMDHSPDIQELEKFFLFMTKLSIEQIDKLNEDQPKDEFEKNKRFPIVFSKNFKNSLQDSQRLALCDLKLTSLTRVNVLKNYTKKISIRNLNYNALNLVPPENNLNSIRNSYVTKTILHNWEARDEEALKRIQENQKDEDDFEEDDFENDNKNKIDNNNQNDSIKEIDEGDKVTSGRGKSKKETKIFKEENSENNNYSEDNIDNSEEKDFDYNSLLVSIKNYCQQNAKEKAKYVDHKFLFLLCREGQMTNEELKRIEKKPELIELLLDTYIEMVKESTSEEKDDDKQKNEEKREKFIQPDTRAIDDEDIIREFFKGDEEMDNFNIPIPPPPPPPPPIVPSINPVSSNNS